MTSQDIYNKVVKHFLSENYHYDSNGICYDDGTKNLIGCLIPDDKFHKRMNNLPIRFGFLSEFGLKDLIPHQTFIEDIESAERYGSGGKNGLAERLIRLAYFLDLEVPEDLLNYNLL